MQKTLAAELMEGTLGGRAPAPHASSLSRGDRNKVSVRGGWRPPDQEMLRPGPRPSLQGEGWGHRARWAELETSGHITKDYLPPPSPALGLTLGLGWIFSHLQP